MTIEKLEKAKSLSVTIGRVTSQLDTLEKSTSLRIRAEYALIQIDIENALLQEQENVIKAMLETFHRILYNPHSGFTYNSLLKHFGFTKIVLTVAHIDQCKSNNRFSNLAALCQRCHLNHDRRHHMHMRIYGNNKNQISLINLENL